LPTLAFGEPAKEPATLKASSPMAAAS